MPLMVVPRPRMAFTIAGMTAADVVQIAADLVQSGRQTVRLSPMLVMD